MRWYLANEPLQFETELVLDDIPVTPDDGLAYLTLRDALGTVIAGYQSKEIAVPGTTFSASIDASANTLASESDTEQRYAFIRFTTGGKLASTSVAYGIHPFLLFQPDYAAVRAALGVTADELPDSDLDLVSAYYTLKNAYSDDFLAALASGDMKRLSANRAIVLSAALSAIPSLQLRAWQGFKSENSTFSRFTKVDWDRLASDISGQLTTAISGISITIGQTNTADVSIFTTSLPTDPVTNT